MSEKKPLTIALSKGRILKETLPLLEAADVAVVVPGADGPHPALREGLESGRFALAPFPHARGWAEAVQRVAL